MKRSDRATSVGNGISGRSVDVSEPAPMRAANVRASIGFAIAGLAHLLGTQRNARIHIIIAMLVTVVGLITGLSRIEWLAIIFAMALVVASEGFNTAIELAVDLASPGYHPLAKTAKDVAAGTVLVAAVAAVLVGAIVFGPRLALIVAGVLASS